MKTLRCLAVFLILSGGFTLTSPAQIASPPSSVADPAAVRARAEITAKAFLAGDFAGVVDLTYPALVKVFGGREKTIRFLEDGISQMKGQGFSFTDYRIGQPAAISTAPGGRRFCVVPTTLMMNGPGGDALTQPSYLLGVAEPGGEWTFLDGNGISPETLKLIALELPPGLILPIKEAPAIKDVP